MPAGSPSKVVAPAAPPLDDSVVRQLAWLDLSTVQLTFAAHHYASLGAIWDLSIEYRRFLLLRLAYPGLDIPAPPLIDIYWRLHAADHERFASDCAQLTSHTVLSPDRLAPPPRSLRLAPGPEIRELYENTFPSGEPELWDWPALDPEQHLRAPALGPIHIRLDSAIDQPTRARLREEALGRRWHVFGARAASTGVGESGAGRKIIDWCTTGSPVLHELHWNDTIPRLIAEQTGAVVSPRGPGYLHYRSGGGVRIHRDTGYDLVLLTLLSGDAEPLHCYPHLADSSAEEIEALRATEGLPAGGTPFEINAVPFLLSGQRIPHHREPRERPTDTVVLSQFYGLLLPPRVESAAS